jgi:hypothetical protein
MTEFHTEPFAELNDFASKIATQNTSYAIAGKSNPKFVHLAKNQIASAQAEYVEFLDALADELPYEQLAVEYSEIEQEIERCLERLPNIDSESCSEKLGAVALANIVAQTMPVLKINTEPCITTRFAQINEQRRQALEQHITDLSSGLAYLDEVYEVAGQAWPVPTAQYIEIEPEPVVFTPNGNGHKPTEEVMLGEIISVIETVTDMPPVEIQRTVEERLQEFRTHYVDQPEAQQLMALFFMENCGSIVNREELADFVYRQNGAEILGTTPPEQRIVILMGPQTHGKRMQKLLKQYGYGVQYGWQQIMQQESNGTLKQITKQRVWRPFELSETNGESDLPEFIETQITSSNGYSSELAAQEQ